MSSIGWEKPKCSKCVISYIIDRLNIKSWDLQKSTFAFPGANCAILFYPFILLYIGGGRAIWQASVEKN